MSNIRDLSNELLLWIVSYLEGSVTFVLAKSCKELDFRLQPNINIQNQACETVLWYSIHYRSYSMVKRLLEQPEVRVDIKHKHDRTALYLAVFVFRIGFVYLLLLRGNNLDLQDDSGYSLWAWVRYFNRLVMKIILSNDLNSHLFFGT
ncbi:unnamed protein product [Penicillium salamii]|uniref:F-box domain-containing protein n=1 Tax=Penicillium salamii TaxID=1612424 RepID=A0A9W4IA87_9EURO|nr:unnamed protein product [Penicillium salamii]CAG8415452.1 unnamed protein product [Penicillium salamii]CAG8418049.1 unnamed protein product [Penicillium salamii]CAG8422162.1 unnamed protein product [Penicillium salamii]